MTQRVVAIGLKIPDNEAYTALVALRRLGVDVDKVERSDVWRFEDTGNKATFEQRLRANEAIFNPNTHQLTILDSAVPRAGEVWISRSDETDSAGVLGGIKAVADVARVERCIGWRLSGADGAPVPKQTLVDAVERLLCNPAIEKARY
jgi:phosphoribosylformylglycinamidine (FGAM) synthase PurS component